MGQHQETHWDPEARTRTETGNLADIWSNNTQELCLMSNNEIWFYFGDQKRESSKHKPKYLEAIKPLIREWAKL
jgi:hypothetical protein